MAIPGVDEQLLRAIGVGIALLDPDSLRLLFFNEKVGEWFAPPQDARLVDLFPDLDVNAFHGAMAEVGRFSLEATVRVRRRPLAITLTATRTAVEGRDLLVVELQNISRIRELEAMLDSYSKLLEKNNRELKREKDRAERLLLNIMPRQVYEEFKVFGVTTPQRYESASVLLLDFVGFTSMAVSRDPTTLIGELNDIFTSFDRIAEQYGCERIKTIGDAYMAVCGLPDPVPDHERTIAKVALLFTRYIERRNSGRPEPWLCRIGIASGPVVGSVVGIQKYVYDIFGPAVNLAARMEAQAAPMEVVLTSVMAEAIRDDFTVTPIGERDIRGFGPLQLCRLDRERHPES